MNDAWLNQLIYYVASGTAFFLGTALVLIGVGLSAATRAAGLLVVRNLAVLVGGILVAISGTPLPYWFYGVLGVSSLSWLIIEWLRKRAHQKVLLAARVFVLLEWLTAAGIEFPYQLTPSLPPLGQTVVWVIGDSVTAGMGDPKIKTWPTILSMMHASTVHDLSQMGATVKSAARTQAVLLDDKDGLVLLQIGGNDLLGKTSASDFETQLEKLLDMVCRRGRTVVMFELPLPPFRNEFGVTQRRLASAYDVKLVPKRIFLRVLTTDGATVDGVHLSRQGQRLMAQTVREILEPVFLKR